MNRFGSRRRWVIYRIGRAAIHCLSLALLTVYRRWVIYQGRSKSNNLLGADKSHSPPVNHAHCLSLSLAQSPSHTHSRSLTVSLSHSLSRSLSLPLTFTLVHSQSPSHSLSLSRSLENSPKAAYLHRKLPPRPAPDAKIRSERKIKKKNEKKRRSLQEFAGFRPDFA